jgi:hypothetical protein
MIRSLMSSTQIVAMMSALTSFDFGLALDIDSSGYVSVSEEVLRGVPTVLYDTLDESLAPSVPSPSGNWAAVAGIAGAPLPPVESFLVVGLDIARDMAAHGGPRRAYVVVPLHDWFDKASVIGWAVLGHV